MLEAAEGGTLWIPGGPKALKLAWYGDPKRPWQVKEGVGKMCTDEVLAQLGTNNTIVVSNKILGDPCERMKKKLLVLVEAVDHDDLFCPGLVVWIYRYRGSLQAASVPCDLPALRRIRCDKRMVLDHGKLAYHRALLTVRARRAATRSVPWQSFADAGEYCPCCHSVYDWQSTTRSRKQRSLWMTNCRACGKVVCTSCTASRLAVQDQGILDPARVCDGCAWRGPEAATGLQGVSQLFAAAVAHAAGGAFAAATATATAGGAFAAAAGAASAASTTSPGAPEGLTAVAVATAAVEGAAASATVARVGGQEGLVAVTVTAATEGGSASATTAVVAV